MKPSHTLTILFSLWLSIACYLPAIYLFTDALLLPKWYLFVGGVACLGMMMAVAMLRGSHLPSQKEAVHVVMMALTVATILECLYTGGCVLADGMSPSGECGTFDTPAGLALSLCVVIPWAGHQARHAVSRNVRLLYGGATLLCVATLLFTRSRTGLVCLALFVPIYIADLFRHIFLNRRLRHSLLAIVATTALTSTFAWTLSHKTDSTSGRAFILRRSMELIMEHPFIGHGPNGFEREYMLRQAQFFKAHPDDAHADLADDIHHPLNEFVFLWVNYGIMATLALLATLALPLLKLPHGCPLRLSMLALLVFSCFSYPFHYPMAWFIAGLSLLLVFRRVVSRWSRRALFPYALLLISMGIFMLTLTDAVHEHLWYRAYRHSFRNKSALAEYEQLHGYFRENPYFLYNYAIASFMHKDLDRAGRLLDECTTISSGYNQELLHGDICFHQGCHPQAVAHYQMAHHMCPVRFAPLEGLCKAYQATGEDVRREEVARLIAGKRVKVNSADVQRIRRQYQ